MILVTQIHYKTALHFNNCYESVTAERIYKAQRIMLSMERWSFQSLYILRLEPNVLDDS